MSISIATTPSNADSVKAGHFAQNLKANEKESAKSEKAEQAIEKFEGLFLSMILKELRKSDSGEGLFPGDKSDTYGGMFDMYVGDHLAKTTDIGIEQMFRSSAALADLEKGAAQLTNGAASIRTKGIEEYRNEQFRAGIAEASGS